MQLDKPHRKNAMYDDRKHNREQLLILFSYIHIYIYRNLLSKKFIDSFYNKNIDMLQNIIQLRSSYHSTQTSRN